MAVPVLRRVGLRYTDECPLQSKNNETFSSYYNSVFSINRFDISYTNEVFFRIVTKKGNYNIIYMEELQKREDQYKLVLDFDGFAESQTRGLFKCER